DWRDVLRILLAGFDHNNIGVGAANWAARNCNSEVRVTLANNYGALFENACTLSSGESTGGVCTQIRHIFRPGDFSDAADTLVSLLGLPAIVPPETTVGGVLQHTGASPFCNAVRPAFVFPSFPDAKFTCLQGSDSTWDPTQKNFGVGCQKENAVYPAAMQDNDPIRRTCVSTEDVCSHSGDLGLVLPINDVAEVAPRTNADRYNAQPCARGPILSVTPPEVFDAMTQARQICLRGLLCPNGDTCNNTGGCFAPVTAFTNGTTQCLASKLTAPGT